jgi:hypothetical protein
MYFEMLACCGGKTLHSRMHPSTKKLSSRSLQGRGREMAALVFQGLPDE